MGYGNALTEYVWPQEKPPWSRISTFLTQGVCIKQLCTHSPGSHLHSLVSRDVATKSCIELEAEGTMKTAPHRNCHRALVLASLLLFSIQWVS